MKEHSWTRVRSSVLDQHDDLDGLSDFTTPKLAKIWEMNANSGNIDPGTHFLQASGIGSRRGHLEASQLAESHESNKEVAAHCMTPSLPLGHKTNWTEFILEQIGHGGNMFNTDFNTTDFNTICVDEVRFDAPHLCDTEKVQIFPGKEKVGSMKVQH